MSRKTVKLVSSVHSMFSRVAAWCIGPVCSMHIGCVWCAC